MNSQRGGGRLGRKVAGHPRKATQPEGGGGRVVGPPAPGATVDAAVSWQGRRLAAEVRRRREARGLSRAKLAELTGIHWRTIENIERGWTWPDFASLIALTHELGIDPLAGVDVAVSAVGTSGFERHLEDERVVSVVGVEVVFARRDRIGLRTLVEDLPALDRADVELLLAEAAAEDAGGQVAVGSAAGGHASLHWQRSGGVAPDQAVVEATGLLRRLFDDVVILSAAVQADYVEAHLKAVVDVGRNRAGGLKL